MGTLTIGSINILNRGDFSKRYKLLYESPQLDKIDILCLQEVMDKELLVKLLHKKGFIYHTFSEKIIDNRGNERNSLAIFSRSELMDDGNNYSIKEHRGHIFGAFTIVNGVRFNIFTIHGAWGFLNEPKRLQQSEIIERYAAELEERNPNSVSVYCGDFNSDENSPSIRFLKGTGLNSTNDYSTLWLDAHSIAGNDENWVTNDHANNNLGRETARRAGIKRTEFLPKRRIDYIFVRGWCYGKNGFPLSYGYITHPSGEEISDHNGVYSTLLTID